MVVADPIEFERFGAERFKEARCHWHDLVYRDWRLTIIRFFKLTDASEKLLAKQSKFHRIRNDPEVLFYLSQIDTYIYRTTLGGLSVTVPEQGPSRNYLPWNVALHAYNIKVKRDGVCQERTANGGGMNEAGVAICALNNRLEQFYCHFRSK
jgi:hypothetical protein